MLHSRETTSQFHAAACQRTTRGPQLDAGSGTPVKGGVEPRLMSALGAGWTGRARVLKKRSVASPTQEAG